MAQRRHASRGRVNWLAVTIPVVILVVGAAMFVILRADEAPPAPEEEAQPPFAFTASDTRFVAMTRRDRAPEDGREAATLAVTTLMSDLYDAAFVTKDRWEGGTFPGVLEKFAPDAAAQAQEHLPELTLGPEAATMDRVLPGESTLDLFFFVRKREAVAVIAHVSFEGTGTLQGGEELDIVHGGSYYLRLVGGVWRIVGYDVQGELETPGAVVPEDRDEDEEVEQ